ncbi:MAG TPA: porin family protein [Salinivirgaceae bacterium]|nr:porin family protein [Salinivirgaceae bacterium]HQA76628.1 porin family protein [Salinivirgaceae bacterium]
MKKLTLLIVLAGVFSIANAQLFKFGIRGGVSSSQVKMSKFVEVPKSGQDTIRINLDPKTPLGFHGGVFSQISILGVYIQPEFLFATTGGEVEIKQAGEVVKTVKQRDLRIDVPLVFGMKLGPARLGLGPVASFNLFNRDDVARFINDEVGSNEKAKTVFKKAVWGLQLDAGVNILGKIALDVKYEFGLSKIGDGIKIGDTKYDFSKRANQFIFSVGYMF